MVDSIKIQSGVLAKVLGRKTYRFSEGINFIVGRNGTGKSLILDTLAHYIPPEPVAPTALGLDSMSMETYFRDFHTKASVGHLGGFMVHRDSRDFRGGLHKSDFTSSKGAGTRAFRSSESAGEEMMSEAGRLFHIGSDFENFVSAVMSYKEGVNKIWEEALDLYLDLFRGKDNTLKPTLLIDEYDSHMDLNSQALFINRLLPTLSKNWQIICVSHSIFAYFSNANVICLDDSKAVYEDHFHKYFSSKKPNRSKKF